MANIQLKDKTSCLVLCEGVDAKYFLIWLLDYYKNNGKPEFEQIQVEDFGGITQLSDAIGVWKNISGFSEKIKSLCIIRDAEQNFLNSCQSIRGALQKASLPVPNHAWTIKTVGDFKVSYILFPGIKDDGGNYTSGTLEDLCLQALADSQKDEKLNAVDDFIASCGNKFALKFPRMHKTRLHEYLVMHDKFVDSKIGEATKAGAFDFGNPIILEIVKIFSDLLK